MRVLVVAGLVALTFSVGCKKAPKQGPTAHSTEAECTEYRNKMFKFNPPEEQEAMSKMNFDKPSPLELKLCMERITSEEIKCALAASTQDEALACKSLDVTAVIVGDDHGKHNEFGGGAPEARRVDGRLLRPREAGKTEHDRECRRQSVHGKSDGRAAALP